MPSRVSSQAALLPSVAASDSYRKPPTAPAGAAIDTLGGSSSTTVITAVVGVTSRVDGVAVSVTSISPSSTSLCIERSMTTPVLDVEFAGKVNVRRASANSKRSELAGSALTVSV